MKGSRIAILICFFVILGALAISDTALATLEWNNLHSENVQYIEQTGSISNINIAERVIEVNGKLFNLPEAIIDGYIYKTFFIDKVYHRISLTSLKKGQMVIVVGFKEKVPDSQNFGLMVKILSAKEKNVYDAGKNLNSSSIMNKVLNILRPEDHIDPKLFRSFVKKHGNKGNQ